MTASVQNIDITQYVGTGQSPSGSVTRYLRDDTPPRIVDAFGNLRFATVAGQPYCPVITIDDDTYRAVDFSQP